MVFFIFMLNLLVDAKDVRSCPGTGPTVEALPSFYLNRRANPHQNCMIFEKKLNFDFGFVIFSRETCEIPRPLDGRVRKTYNGDH